VGGLPLATGKGSEDVAVHSAIYSFLNLSILVHSDALLLCLVILGITEGVGVHRSQKQLALSGKSQLEMFTSSTGGHVYRSPSPPRNDAPSTRLAYAFRPIT